MSTIIAAIMGLPTKVRLAWSAVVRAASTNATATVLIFLLGVGGVVAIFSYWFAADLRVAVVGSLFVFVGMVFLSVYAWVVGKLLSRQRRSRTAADSVHLNENDRFLKHVMEPLAALLLWVPILIIAWGLFSFHTSLFYNWPLKLGWWIDSTEQRPALLAKLRDSETTELQLAYIDALSRPIDKKSAFELFLKAYPDSERLEIRQLFDRSGDEVSSPIDRKNIALDAQLLTGPADWMYPPGKAGDELARQRRNMGKWMEWCADGLGSKEVDSKRNSDRLILAGSTRQFSGRHSFSAFLRLGDQDRKRYVVLEGLAYVVDVSRADENIVSFRQYPMRVSELDPVKVDPVIHFKDVRKDEKVLLLLRASSLEVEQSLPGKYEMWLETY